MSGNLILESAPHDLSVSTTGKVMRTLILTLIPALIATTWFYGFGTLITTLITIVSCVGSEALWLKLRKRRIAPVWRDCSALTTAVLLGLTLPPLLPWYLSVIGSVFAIIVVKQVYGGLGQNLFNPAMAGFVFLLISCPLPMTTYVDAMPDAYKIITPGRAAAIIFDVNSAEAEKAISQDLGTADYLKRIHEAERSVIADGFTGSTFLVDAKHEQPEKNVKVFAEAKASDFIFYGLLAKVVIAGCFLLGGILLIVKDIIDWRIPLSFLGVSTVLTAAFYFAAPELYLSPWHHLVYGATIFGAFYIMTDPVTAVSKPSAAWIFGGVIAVLFVIIRNLGGYPDAVAFSVLLGNACAPLISIMTRRREFGQGFKPENIND